MFDTANILYASGYFAYAGGNICYTKANGIVKYENNKWIPLYIDESITNAISIVQLVFNNNNLYICGYFRISIINPIDNTSKDYNNIARYDLNSQEWIPLCKGSSALIYTMEFDYDKNIYIGTINNSTFTSCVDDIYNDNFINSIALLLISNQLPPEPDIDPELPLIRKQFIIKSSPRDLNLLLNKLTTNDITIAAIDIQSHKCGYKTYLVVGQIEPDFNQDQNNSDVKKYLKEISIKCYKCTNVIQAPDQRLFYDELYRVTKIINTYMGNNRRRYYYVCETEKGLKVLTDIYKIL